MAGIVEPFEPTTGAIPIADGSTALVAGVAGYPSAAARRSAAGGNGAGSGRPALRLLEVSLAGVDPWPTGMAGGQGPATLFIPVISADALGEAAAQSAGIGLDALGLLARLARVPGTSALPEDKASLGAVPAPAGLWPLQPVLATAQPGESPDSSTLRQIKRQLAIQVASAMGRCDELSKTPAMVAKVEAHLADACAAMSLRLPDSQQKQLFAEVTDDILGFGPIEPLLADPTVTEVMVNGPQRVYIEREGRVSKTAVTFDDDDHVLRTIERIVRPLGRRVDRNSPMVDARLPDGSRVNAIIHPCAIDGPSITIRKFSKDRLTIENLIAYGSVTPEVASFLKACVRARLNVIVSGGTGSGKTTLLNVLSSFIPEHERIVTIEDSAELQLHQEHTVRLECRPPDPDGCGEITVRSLVKNALRMRPDRIIVGEVRGGESLDMLQAMNTGHDGSLTTIHANTPRDTISRLETLVLTGGVELPLKVIRAQIASAINLIVQQARMRDGTRKITSVTEVQGMEGEIVVLCDLFTFKEQPSPNGKVMGELDAMGLRPRFYDKLELAGCQLPVETFTPARMRRPAVTDPRARR